MEEEEYYIAQKAVLAIVKYVLHGPLTLEEMREHYRMLLVHFKESDLMCMKRLTVDIEVEMRDA